MEKLKEVLFEKEYQLNNLSEDDLFTEKHRKLLKEIKVLNKSIKILNEATVNEANRVCELHEWFYSCSNYNRYKGCVNCPHYK